MEGTKAVTVPDLDIWRSARLLIDQHDADAPIHAAMRVDELLDKGDLDGRAKRRRCREAWKPAPPS